jgi:murein DD-endopeptidase MepM/ murein hydrolase activator NlpD
LNIFFSVDILSPEEGLLMMKKCVCFLIYALFLGVIFSVAGLGAELSLENRLFSVKCRAAEFRPGELFIFEVRPSSAGKIISVKGAFLETAMEFYPVGDAFIALFGVPAKIAPGKYDAFISAKLDNGKEVGGGLDIMVRKRMFKISRLTVDPLYIEYTPENLKRIEEEKQVLIALWKRTTPEKLWDGIFIYPVASDITQDFAIKRIFQGEFRSYHSGIDLRARIQDNVYAANRGKVVLTGDHFFSGNFVIIDHGRRLFSFYAHLSEIKVKEGEAVEKGQVIALSCDTGRVTGPHLHWTMKVNSVNIDPISLTMLPLY